jgi:hypothetical protein
LEHLSEKKKELLKSKIFKKMSAFSWKISTKKITGGMYYVRKN